MKRILVFLILLCLVFSNTASLGDEAEDEAAYIASVFSSSQLQHPIPSKPDDTVLVSQRISSGTAVVHTTDDETVIEDFEAGFWYYRSVSQDLRIVINRYKEGERDKLWYEVDILAAPSSPLTLLYPEPDKPCRKFWIADRIAREYDSVFSLNDDMAGWRIYNHHTVGIVVRNQTVISNKSRSSGNKKLPNLDLAALFPNGTMKCFQSWDYSAQDYIDMGATDTLVFGPYLIRDGEMNPLLDTVTTYKSTERRIAIGMVEPWHYVVVYTEGWNPWAAGCGLDWVARKMLELGVTEAINLDGGHTTSMFFMGKKIRMSNPEGLVKTDTRSASGLISFGVSRFVAEYHGVDE